MGDENMNGQKIDKKEKQEIIGAINNITTSLILLKTFSEKHNKYGQFSCINSLVDKVPSEFEKIANKF